MPTMTGDSNTQVLKAESNGQLHQHKQAWWKEAVIYQIYPSSFLDTNGECNDAGL